jgi:hypothetical protein
MRPSHHHGAASTTRSCTSTRRTKLKVVNATPIARIAPRTTSIDRRVVGTAGIVARVGTR